MQEDPLIGLRELQDVTHVVSWPAFDVAQADHEALCGWKGVDRGRDQVASLLCVEVIPRLRKRRPAAGELRVPEARRVYGWLGFQRFTCEGGKGDASRLAFGSRLGGVRDDPEDPGLERCSTFESVQPA